MLSHLKKIPYSKRILMYLFALVALLLLLISISLFRSYQNAGVRLMQEYNQKLINQVVKNYETIDNTIVSLLTIKYAQPEVVDLLYQESLPAFEKNAALNKLREEISSYPMYHSALLYNNRTKYIDYLGITQRQATPIVENIYQGDGVPAITTVPLQYSENGTNKLLFSYYAYDYLTDHSVLNGALVINIKTDWIQELVESSGMDSLKFMIVDEDGRIILDSDGEGSYGAALDRDYLPGVLEGSSAQSFSSRNGRGKMLVTTQRIKKTDWTLICEQPFAAYKNLMRPVQINTVLMTLALMVLAFIGTLLLSKYIYRPVRNLVRRAQDLTDAPMSESDEFSYLLRVLHSNTDQHERMEEMEKSISDIKRQNYFKLLLEEGAIEEDSGAFADCAEFASSGQFFAVMLRPKERTTFGRVRAVWSEWAEPLLEQWELVPLAENEIVALVRETGSVNVLRSRFLEQYPYLQKKFREQELTVSLFVTRYYPPDQLSQIYTELQRLCKYELMYSAGCCINDEVIARNHDTEQEAYPLSAANRLLHALRNKEMESTEADFDAFLSEILKYDADNFRIALMRLALSIQNLYEETNIHKNSKVYAELGNVVKKIATLSSMDNVQVYFTSLFALICQREEGTPVGRHYAVVKSVADYISLSFADPNLNLEQIAEVFKMSPNYLAKLFREEHGVSISAYINSVRLNESLTLLNDTDLPVKAIMEQIGFINESSFYKQFKKQFGITPKEYRINRILIENIQD